MTTTSTKTIKCAYPPCNGRIEIPAHLTKQRRFCADVAGRNSTRWNGNEIKTDARPT